MPLYPVNLKITDRPCLVVGGGAIAARKVGSLLFCGARVRVVSPEAGEDIRQLALAGKIVWQQRAYRTGDLDGVFLAIAATDRPDVQRQISDEASGLPTLLNSVDDPDVCDFQVPSQLRRGELLITVSTGGASPAFSKQIRDQLETEFGWEYGAAVILLARLREMVVGNCRDSEAHAKLFRDVLALDIVELVRKAEWQGLTNALRDILPAHLDSDAVVQECIAVVEKRNR
jgi:precorrin-2 dehydrogenase / sirohydrochlorin ferrochelatase